MNRKRLFILGLLLLLVVGLGVWSLLNRRKPEPIPSPAPTPSLADTIPVTSVSVKPSPSSTPFPSPVIKKVQAKPPVVPVAPVETPPPVAIHKELIPKDIQIVRVYYAQSLTGPGSVVEFDINGSGFNKEFHQMITVESGSPHVSIKNLELITLNQIHGVLVIKSDAPTGAVFPQVLIQGKVVFRAPEPFAVIRPGEVMNLIFTEMGENGRTGRFRVFTNLTQDMFAKFSVTSSSEGIHVTDFTPNLPFIVDGTLNIGSAPAGSYPLEVKLGEVIIWERDGIIRVIQPNVGQSGLAQQIRAIDSFLRPGDKARFVLQGSGFQPQDVDLLSLGVDNFSLVVSSMIYKSPGRMEFSLIVPPDAAEGSYRIRIFQKDNELLVQENVFTVVGRNWVRELQTDPPLKPGSTGLMKVVGRDMARDFVESLRIELDTDELSVGPFLWVNPELATASINVAPTLLPGDYLIKMNSRELPVIPRNGNVIRVLKN